MKVYDDADGEDDAEMAVGLAEYAVATDSERLRSSGIGSCVVVALRDEAAEVSGMLHFMLPSSAEIDDENAAKFADTGVDRLVAAMESEGADPDRMEAKLVGGANMLDLAEKRKLIGTRNVRAAKEKLDGLGIPIVGEATGGSHGRSIVFEGADGTLRVRGPHVETVTL